MLASGGASCRRYLDLARSGHLANTFGNSSQLVVYPGESLSLRTDHERAIPSAANCKVRRP